MSLETKIEKLTNAVTQLTDAVVTMTTQMVHLSSPESVAERAGEALETIKEQAAEVTTEVVEETAAEKKKKRDAKRQAEIEAETKAANEAKAEAEEEQHAEETGAAEEPAAEREVTVVMLRKVASYLIKNGKKPQWHEALKATGASKLSEVEDRAALLVTIEGIAGMSHDEIPDA